MSLCELSNATSLVSLPCLVSRLREIIHTDVLAWRQEARRWTRADCFLTLHPPPLTPEVTNRFSLSFFQKMRRSFLGRYLKTRKNQAVCFLMSSKNTRGGQNHPSLSSRARVKPFGTHARSSAWKARGSGWPRCILVVTWWPLSYHLKLKACDVNYKKEALNLA